MAVIEKPNSIPAPSAFLRAYRLLNDYVCAGAAHTLDDRIAPGLQLAMDNGHGRHAADSTTPGSAHPGRSIRECPNRHRV